jgi:tetratricopeptide (TPR) repeat protein
MDNEVKPKADIYSLVAWAHANRQRLIWITAAVVIIGGAIGIYAYHKNSRETEASAALSEINFPTGERSTNATAAEPYLKVAADYAGTSAAARALLLAGGVLFDAGKYSEARRQFERFLADYSDYPLADQALIGVAKSYEAEGNLAEATTRYRDFVERHPTDSAVPDAKSALARVYLAQNKPELALQEYEDLLRSRNNDSWTAEAGIQREELLAKYPALRKQAPAPTPSPATTLTLPTAPKAQAPASPITASPKAPAPTPTGPSSVPPAKTNKP